MTNIVVCSFFTTDDYYAQAADRLRGDLEKLGVESVLQPMERRPDEDWSDICRKKVPFLHDVCSSHPGARVVWVDVDCRLLALPDAVVRSSADIVGFARGFSSALQIGYKHRTRFWEPCFWGVGPSDNARKMIEDAAKLERTSTVKATDDFFFEEAWRANADQLTFQVLPSGYALGRGDRTTQAFLVFGASGSVAEFKSKVAQHEPVSWPARGGQRDAARSVRTRVYERVKKTVHPARDLVVDRAINSGQHGDATERLKADVRPVGKRPGPRPVGKRPGRERVIKRILKAGMDGDPVRLEGLVAELGESLLSQSEQHTIEAARMFAAYATEVPDRTGVALKWWARPFPGNFGDWLSPYIVGSVAHRSVRFIKPASSPTTPHLVALGSIGKFADPNSIVVGTGVSAKDAKLDPTATYVSLRGPLTANVLRANGGPAVTAFGDPGIAIERLFPVAPGDTNGRLALVRHYVHQQLPVRMPEEVEELSVLGGSKPALHSLLTDLHRFDGVVTTAMHVMIACHSYGIPCALVTFEGFEDAVRGDGMKYEDYALGAGLAPIRPIPVPLHLDTTDLRSRLTEVRIGDDVKDAVMESLRTAVDFLDLDRE